MGQACHQWACHVKATVSSAVRYCAIGAHFVGSDTQSKAPMLFTFCLVTF